uniref:DUF2382 domain-containing protein n=1 Tax=Solibacter usitatus (strain Ellin6076) TaxID=234267 RepID=Q01PI0_SOLUE
MAQNPTSTVVGVFDEYRTAESVARDLANQGIPRENINVRSNFMTGAAGKQGTSNESEEGGISGFFHRLFGGGHESEEAGHYSEAVRRGSAVVSVTAPPEQIEAAVALMNERGAIDIDRRVQEYRKTGYERHDPNAPAYSFDEAVREREQSGELREGASIPVVEEELQVGKRVVRRGGVRVYSHVTEQPVEENIELREEHVRVERRPVDRTLERGEAGRLRDQSVEVSEMVEEPVIQKRARVREEVVVGKETTQRTEKIRDNVRRTEVKVENLESETGTTGEYRDDFRRDYETRYAGSSEPYETVQPAYEYGYSRANDTRYQGRQWSDVEEDLRTDYMRQNPNSSWDRVKGAVRYGWEKVTGKR